MKALFARVALYQSIRILPESCVPAVSHSPSRPWRSRWAAKKVMGVQRHRGGTCRISAIELTTGHRKTRVVKADSEAAARVQLVRFHVQGSSSTSPERQTHTPRALDALRVARECLRPSVIANYLLQPIAP
jgi:hypothetical protein